MRKSLKASLLVFSTLLLLALIPPGLLLFGSENIATTTRLLLSTVTDYSVDAPTESLIQQRLKVPDGFSVSLYADNLANVRFLKFTRTGDLLATRPRQGDVLLLTRDSNGDGRADNQTTLLQGLNRPHGIDLWNGWLYIAEADAIGRVRFDEVSATLQGEYQRIVEGLGAEGNHWTKTLRIGPDGWMYISAGSSCNACEEKDPARAAISRYRPDGSQGEVYASGLRNSVGMDWAPWNSQLYATDNGRDLLGDDFPPCELNQIVKNGFYGWPFINGFGDLDPDYGEGKDAMLATAISPVFGFKAHNAPLGITFIRQTKAPAGYDRAALVALHGSWNRTERDGYKVVSLHWQADGSIVEKDFLTGFLGANDVIGRPVDVAESPDGAIYVSDDYAGVIYRVAYGEPSIAQRKIEQQENTRLINLQSMKQRYSATEISAHRKQGEQLFQQYRCGNCHDSRQLRSGATLVSLKQVSARYSLDELSAFFVAPTPPMPVFPLNEEQRESLAVYLYSQ